MLTKSRLTPINKPSLTIPRLELEASLIAARLFKTIVQEIKIPVSKISLWSDSTTVVRMSKTEKHNLRNMFCGVQTKLILSQTLKIGIILKLILM